MILRYEKLKSNATPPSKAYPQDAGWDVFAGQEYTVRPGMIVTIPTGLALKLEPSAAQEEFAAKFGVSWYLRAADKSGLASREGVHVLGGVVDRNYRGEVGIVVANLGFWKGDQLHFGHWHVKPGEKICQIVPEMIWDAQDAHEGPVGESDRGDNGFGSTGK